MGTECIFNREVAKKVRQKVKCITEMRWEDESSIKAFVRLVIRYNMHLSLILNDDEEGINKIKENQYYVRLP